MLNADDPRVLAMRAVDQGQAVGLLPRPRLAGDPRGARPTAAGPPPSSTAGSRCSRPDADPDPLVELVDVPMTLAGLSRFNVENALARRLGRAGGRAARATAVVEGLRTFRPDAEHNPGRMNFFSPSATSRVVMDLAHNEAGLEALLEIMNGVRRPGARLLLGARRRGRPAGRAASSSSARSAPGTATSWSIAHKERYLRGRTTEELDDLLRAGRGPGRRRPTSRPTRPRSRASPRWSSRPSPGDVVGADVPRGAPGRLRLARRARRHRRTPPRRCGTRCGRPAA